MMADLIRSPFDELRALFDQLERRRSAWSRPGSEGVVSPFDVSRDDQQMRLRVPLPGVAPEDVELTVTGRTLTVRGIERDGDTTATRYEQVFTLPESVDLEKAGASLRHGLLEVTLPYSEAVKPRRIEIAVGEPKQLPKAA